MNAQTRPMDADALRVDLASLGDLRQAVSRHAKRCGLIGTAAKDIVLIANELATNIIRHGGGTGRIWLWCSGDRLYCQASDCGAGMHDPERAGAVRADPSAS